MRRIVLLALMLGLALLLLPLAQYRFLFVRNTESVYVGLVSVLCAGAGIWAGLSWRARLEAKAALRAGIAADEATATALGLTQREVEVLQYIAEGKSNQEIAAAMFVSLNTVKTHVSNLFSKLDVQRRTQAVQKARAMKLIP
ncbi:MAG: response regulator transcription factor [Chitinophagales bacterium]|nr:response regulator transcription factor [Chitinophagales bacterium]